MVRHLDHLNLNVRNLADSERFYASLFGFRRVEAGTADGGPWAILRAGEAMLCLYETPSLARLAAEPRLNHFALRLAEAEPFLAAVARERVPFDYGDGEIRYPHSRSWYVRDPSGHQIEAVVWDEDTVRFDAS